MNKIEELIKRKCPDGVKYVPLNTVCKIYDGTHSTPKYIDYGVRFVSVENIGNLYASEKYISEEDYRKFKITPQINDIFMTRIGSIGVCSVVDKEEPLAYYVSLALLRPNPEKLDSYFLKYAIESFEGQKELYKRTLVNAVPIKVNKDDIGKILVPVPPLDIQQEIVRVLDKFTELDKELNSELDNRRKQYLYAMDELVALRDDVTDVTIGEAFDIITDYTAAGSFADLAKNVVYNDSPDYAQLVRTMDIKSKFTKGAPVYVSESAFKYLWRVNLDSEAIVLPNIGNCGEVYYVEPKDLPYDNNVLGPNAILARSTKHNNRYLAYTLQTAEFQRQLRKIISPAGQTKFNKTDLKKLIIKVPSIEEQEKIVELLDKFDTICNDHDCGLPAEIEARHKQYEYYRDKLLTFERKVV